MTRDQYARQCAISAGITVRDMIRLGVLVIRGGNEWTTITERDYTNKLLKKEIALDEMEEVNQWVTLRGPTK